MKVKKQITINERELIFVNQNENNIEEVMKNARNLNEKNSRVFFEPTFSDLYDPFLLPDMESAVKRILEAKNKKERVVIFGDYDVDGVSSTALLVRFLTHELEMQVSYRLPHRVHDGYGLKSYFFDELATKNVALVITVDCGTRDVEPIQHAKNLGIDVIVTDHHAVPEVIPEGIIAIINPKRPESQYPFSQLAGAGVAYKLLHALVIHLYDNQAKREEILKKYIDIASLGTVADCMPLVDENRIITKLGLKQMTQSKNPALAAYAKNSKNEIEDNADIIGFQIGPRINASGRMDTPMIALKWLLAGQDRCEDFYEILEELNLKRRSVVIDFTEKALEKDYQNKGVLFFEDDQLEHGLIGLVAGRLTEKFNRPSIVLCPHSEASTKTRKHREYEIIEQEPFDENEGHLVASCRAPEWCDIIGLLDACKQYLVRYGGHKQAAGFTIETKNFKEFEKAIQAEFNKQFDLQKLPHPSMRIEGILTPEDLSLETLEKVEKFRPFGIGNPHPYWLIENITIQESAIIGSENSHLMLRISGKPNIKFLYWGGASYQNFLEEGNIVSLIVSLQKNEWKGNVSLQCIVQDIRKD